ncbi:hypothetical protein LAZ67_1002321 [Cordylochernes scorpioides]|uniref:Uncharacterized protein n=1 Tax=Cordylochernes scorpioides TaxID=51811 RepID=A0ABY6JXF6_9ARAC|nr:hypothetical protein LAZ67_1002321 [Cordylochernes scorpioides]
MDEAMEEVVEEEMNRCFEALKKHQAIDVNYIDFLEVDKDVQVAGEQSIEEIVKEVMGKEEDEEMPCAAAPNKEYRLILYPWIRSPYRVLSARPAEPRFFSELVTAPPSSFFIRAWDRQR